MSTDTLPPLARRAGRVFAWALFGLLILGVLLATWVGARGALAYQHLQRVQTGAAASTAAVASDPSEAVLSLASVASDAADAHALTSDPIWSLAEHLPWVGPQLKAFGTVAASSDELLRQSLLPLATAAQDVSLESLKPVDGRIDTGMLAELVGPASDAAARAEHAALTVRDIDRTPLVGAVGTAVDRASDLFGQVSSAVDGLSRAAQLMPAMLGESGPRYYLLLVQNNAEWRSLGGITGTTILLRTEGGAISLVDTQSATALSQGLPVPAVGLPDVIQKIYGTKPTRYFHNLTQIPDFSVDGPLAREMYRLKTGIDVNGVLAMDPVALSYLLNATGPVTLPTGDVLDADSAVPFLLNKVYLDYADPAAQDAVFAGAAGTIFQALLEGRGSASGLIEALGRAGEEHRVLVWSADPAEQAVLEGTAIAGQLPVTDERTTRFGVFLNDATGSKMSYYVRPDVSLSWGACQPAGNRGERQVTLTLTLTSDAPPDAATALPWYITGGGVYGTPPGIAKVVGNIYLPQGFELASEESSDGQGFTEANYQGRHVLTFGTDLSPGASTTVTVAVRGASSATEAQAIVTPTADSRRDPTVTSICGAG